jgi:TolB-like protein/Flp pilus assembly protein TadD
VTEPSHAVFLSYASQDAEPARKICDALRAAGIEVWFDQSELRGGDAWDQSIRKQIKTCALFLPIISKNTHERAEGYFRLEWKLAVDRSHLIMANKAFLVPVVIDDTAEDDENVPEKFREVQWTRLRGGETPPEFIARIKRLLSSDPLTTVRLTADAASGSSPVPLTARRPSPLRRALPVAVAVLVVGALAYLLINKPWTSKPTALPAPTNAASSPGVAAAAFAPPPHSIAVLPFVNMSGDKEQEYFSDGLTEELLNSLAEIEGLQVAGRTSSFYFKGKDVDLGTVAHKLNVGAVLEGSVRRSAHTVRITAQLVNAVTGFHLWSKTYDRELGDVLKLQTEIATAVASALKVSLLGDVSAKIELGGTRNPAAFDAYLRASKAFTQHQDKDLQSAIAAYTEAIRLDSNYSLALAGRSIAYSDYANEFATGAAVAREGFEKAQADARKAIGLAPELAEGHLALGRFLQLGSLDFAQANRAFEQALALAPGNAQVLRESGLFAVFMGRFDAGLSALRRAVVLNPLDPRTHAMLSEGLYYARRYQESVAAGADVISLDSDYARAYEYRGVAYYVLGELERARTSCEAKADYWSSQWCLAVVYDKLGRHADAEAELAKLKATAGEAYAYQYALIYAQWGNLAKALEWLDTTMRLRDPGLHFLKTDPLMDPLRREPRFQAIERELKFPQ